MNNITVKITAVCRLILFAAVIAGCAADNVLTQEEVARQNRVAGVVTEVLFENDMDQNASYNIRKDGYVVIQFDGSVPENKYTQVVNRLRADNSIPGVWAEQSGVEVCPLR